MLGERRGGRKGYKNKIESYITRNTEAYVSFLFVLLFSACFCHDLSPVFSEEADELSAGEFWTDELPLWTPRRYSKSSTATSEVLTREKKQRHVGMYKSG